MSIKVKVQKNRFPHFARQFPRYAEQLVAATAGEIESKARAKAPVGKTGTLKRSFGKRSKRRKRNVARWIVWNNAAHEDGEFYSGYVEYGTKYAKARKFLKPTARAEIRAFRKRAGEIESKLK